jgi:CubicO group peptidase (beta-lactamase class C family)
MQLRRDELQARLDPLFHENFERFGELGAAVSVWQDGKSLLDFWGGFRDARRDHPWTNDTIVLIWSATKGIASSCLLHALQENGIDIEQRVAKFWPEFAQAGKETITLAQLLSHQAGLAALDLPVDILDFDAVIRALEMQQPNWSPGTAHGYHARTFGFLLDELVRRIAGCSLGEYLRGIFAEPLDLDLWIGLPQRENSRAASIYPPKAGKRPEREEFYADVATRGTFANRVFTSPHGLQAVSAMNKPEIRALPIGSFGGIGSANSLAKFYAMLANDGELEDRKFLAPKTLSWMTTTLIDGLDRVFQIPTAFSAGLMKDSRLGPGRLFGKSKSSFGHPGAGGSHAFADPENRIAFAYVMNQMEQKVLPNEKSLRLVDAIYQS